MSMNNVNELHEKSLSFLDRFALFLTNWIGTIYCFIIFCILVFIPFAFPSTLTMVQFISSAFLQLVLLPLIMVAGNLQQRHAEFKAEEDYQINIKAEKEIEELKKSIEEINNKLDHLLSK